MKRTTILGICITAFLAIAAWAPNGLAYEYNGSCTSCHNWFSTSHNNHMNRTSCSTCHDNNRNGYTTASSCSSCHDAAPLQTNHINNYGVSSCEGCHPQSPPPSCIDNDGDGYGNPGDASCANGSQTDCNDNDRAINPGAAENCTDGVDNNCNNLVDAQDPNALNCPIVCIDVDGDTYATNGGECGAVDCDDNDVTVNPGAFEICDDGIDNDCNNQFDCDDNACTGDPACLAEFCEDYNDRRSCKEDYRCDWSGKGKSCYQIDPDQLACEESGGRWNRKKGVCR